MKLFELRPTEKKIIGMIHVRALPGTPLNNQPISEILKKSVEEANILKKYDFDALILENMHDVPYINTTVGPEIVSAMTVIAHEVKKVFQKPCGIQILAGANKEALAVAKAAECDFIRAEGFVFSHIADEGLMNSCAAELLRFRKQINAEDISVFTDIKKKHSSHSITADISLSETAKAAEFFLSDGLIITGSSTGVPASKQDLIETNKVTNLPILIGSGLTIDNLESYWDQADGFIIGSHLKKNGLWKNELCENRISNLLKKVSLLRNKYV